MNLLDEKFFLTISLIIFICIIYKPLRKTLSSFLDDQITLIKDKFVKSNLVLKDAQLLLTQIEKNLAIIESTKDNVLEQAKVNANNLVKEKVRQINYLKEIKKLEVASQLHQLQIESHVKMREELMKDVSTLIISYLKVSCNNSLSDKSFSEKFLLGIQSSL